MLGSAGVWLYDPPSMRAARVSRNPFTTFVRRGCRTHAGVLNQSRG